MLRSVLLLSLAGFPALATAQAVPARRAPARWHLSVGPGLAAFSNAASRQDGAGTTGVRPAPATRFGMALWRRVEGWEVGVGTDLLAAGLQVRDDAVAVEARNAPFTRVRGEIVAGRTIARIGQAGLLAAAGPALELWRPSGGELRTRLAAGARLALRLDAGPFALENSVAAGISASPLEEEDLPEGYRRLVLRSTVIAVELRFGL